MSRIRRTGRLIRPRLVALGLIALLAVAACGGSASAVPSGNGGQPPSSGEPGATPEGGDSGPTEAPAESSAGDGSDAFSAATSALDALDSYAFRVELQSSQVSNGTTSTTHSLYEGVVVNKPAVANSLKVSELDADGNVTSGTEFVVIGADAWLRDVGGGDWAVMPASQVASLVTGFRPEQMFAMYFGGYGGNFTTVGSEEKNGVQTTHFKGDEALGAILGTIAGVNGSWTSDAWIANDGGFLVHSEAGVQAANGSDGGSFSIVVDISDVNSAGPIEKPA